MDRFGSKGAGCRPVDSIVRPKSKCIHEITIKRLRAYLWITSQASTVDKHALPQGSFDRFLNRLETLFRTISAQIGML